MSNYLSFMNSSFIPQDKSNKNLVHNYSPNKPMRKTGEKHFEELGWEDSDKSTNTAQIVHHVYFL